MTDREIIIYLAEKVMGWKIRAVALTSGIFDAPDGKVYCWPSNWNPLESIADAFEVNEKLGGFDMIAVDDGWMVGNGTSGYTNDEGRVEVQLEFFAIAKTLPRAICMSAVEATK